MYQLLAKAPVARYNQLRARNTGPSELHLRCHTCSRLTSRMHSSSGLLSGSSTLADCPDLMATSVTSLAGKAAHRSDTAWLNVTSCGRNTRKRSFGACDWRAPSRLRFLSLSSVSVHVTRSCLPLTVAETPSDASAMSWLRASSSRSTALAIVPCSSAGWPLPPAALPCAAAVPFEA